MYETLLNLEKKFFEIKYISDKNWLNDTLHNDFLECGKSGTLFSKKEVMEELLLCLKDRDIEIFNFVCELIGENCWLVHYVTETEDELFFRTSIWVYENQLQMRFHQATKLSFNVQ